MSERAIREYENSRVLVYSGPRRYSGRVVCRSKGSASRFISVERPFAAIHADAFSLFLPLCLYRFTIHRYLQLPTAIPFVLIFLVFLRFIFSLFLSFFFFFFFASSTEGRSTRATVHRETIALPYFPLTTFSPSVPYTLD